jgi:hypothetical protein
MRCPRATARLLTFSREIPRRLLRGTEGSNPLPSTGESANFRSLGAGAAISNPEVCRATARGRCVGGGVGGTEAEIVRFTFRRYAEFGSLMPSPAVTGRGSARSPPVPIEKCDMIALSLSKASRHARHSAHGRFPDRLCRQSTIGRDDWSWCGPCHPEAEHCVWRCNAGANVVQADSRPADRVRLLPATA